MFEGSISLYTDTSMRPSLTTSIDDPIVMVENTRNAAHVVKRVVCKEFISAMVVSNLYNPLVSGRYD